MFRSILLFWLLSFLATDSWAQWQLDADKSSITYLSTKILSGVMTTAIEHNGFGSISGVITGDGSVVITIDASSVHTGVKSRDELVEKYIFLSDQYPEITIFLNVSEQLVNRSLRHFHYDGEAQVMMRGVSHNVPVSVVVNTSQGDGLMHVHTKKPILFDALKFGTAKGFHHLQEVVNLASIATSIPVSVDLHFSHQ